MIHENFRKLLRSKLGASGIYDYTDYTGYTGSDSTNDNAVTYSSSFYLMANTTCTNLTLGGVRAFNTSTYYAILYAALGNTADEEEDYTLGSFMSSNILITTSVTKTTQLLHTTTLLNSSDSDFSFNEIGLFIHLYASGSNYKWNGIGSPKTEFLLIKEVLDTPMTIPAGSSISITFNLLGDVTVEES